MQIQYSELLKLMDSLPAAGIYNRAGYYEYVSKGWEMITQIHENELHLVNWQSISPHSGGREAMELGITIKNRRLQVGNLEVLCTYVPRFNQENEVDGVYFYASVIGVEDFQELLKQLKQMEVDLKSAKDQLGLLRTKLYGIENIIGESDAIIAIKKQIYKAASSSAPVLIEGESGTGKELIAQAIHSLSGRSKESFIKVNCSAIPIELAESEFFGYSSGSFTGATKGGKIGRFEAANRGTIFLDEVNLLPQPVQPKLLRVLQEKEIQPIGESKNIPIDVRIISATNASLQQWILENKFREDLYYRLDVIHIVSPPLRERKTDIPILVNYLLKTFNAQNGTFIRGITEDAMALLKNYHWPGNIREMRNSIESAICMTENSILTVEDFPRILKQLGNKELATMSTPSSSLKSSKKDLEQALIYEALDKTGGNISEASKLLGISRPMLYKKIKSMNRFID